MAEHKTQVHTDTAASTQPEARTESRRPRSARTGRVGRQQRRARSGPGKATSGKAGLDQAIRPGMSGGAYKPLSDKDIQRIHNAALDLLEKVGMGDPIPEILHYALPGGCYLGEQGRLHFPRALMEDLISQSVNSYMAYAPDPAFDFEVGGDRVYFTTSGESVSILDYDSQSFRPTRLVDLYDAARLADTLDNIHQFGQPFIAAEFSHDVFVHDLNIAYAELAACRKPFALGIAQVEHIDPIVDLFDTYLGKEGAFLQRPFCTFGGCPVVSPLRFGKENAEVLVKIAQLGLVSDVAIAPQAGATAPAALAGSLVQAFAETLACLAVVNLVRPGSVINFGMWPFVSDLRTGSFTGGSGEEALLMAATAQLCNYFGLISSTACGMTDAKTMDAQAGFEKAITTTALALSGSNLIAAYPGIVGSLIGQSFEGMVIDNDMIGNVQRLLRGIEVNDETLSYDVISDVVSRSGHYLDHPQTLSLMQTEFHYPDLADRCTPGAWEENGSPTIYQQAHERVRETLTNHYLCLISTKADARIRDRFPIRLERADMNPGNGRW